MSQLIQFEKPHQELVTKYLAFFSKKKDECFKQVKLTIEDTQYDNRNANLFTKVEFDEIMQKLQDDIEETVQSELQMFYRMSGVMVQMMMFEAEQQKISLGGVDVNAMENYKALEEMKEYENLTKNQNIGNNGAFLLNPLQKKSTLSSLGNALQAKIDLNVQNQNHTVQQEQMTQENEKLKQQIQNLQRQISEMMHKKNQEASQLTSQLEGTKKDTDNQLVEMESKLMLREEEKSQAIEAQQQLKRELQNQKEEAKKKVNQLTQVNNMKKMIVEKNNQLKALRERLSKYENLDDD